jgi:hypothetical protein
MSSFEKYEKYHNRKKQLFNGGAHLLSPLNKKINSLNYFGINKKNNDIQSKNDIKVIVSKLNPDQLRKKNNNINSEQINNILKVNRAYSLSRAKNNIKLDNNQIIGTYSNINTTNLSTSKTNNGYENNLTSENIYKNKNNIDINNDSYNLKKLYINKKIKDISIFAKNDSFNKIKNYSANRQPYVHLQTETNILKDSNIKLIIPDRGFFEKKLENKNLEDIIGTPSGLFKKNNQTNFQYNPRNPNIKMHRDEKIIIDSLTNQSTNDSKNKKIQQNIDRSISGKDYSNFKNIIIKNKCPEDLHFYYITMVQQGKNLEKEIEGE